MKLYAVGYYDGWYADLEKGIHDVYLAAEVREKMLPVLDRVGAAISTLNEDAFGIAYSDGQPDHPIKPEILTEITDLITEIRQIGDDNE